MNDHDTSTGELPDAIRETLWRSLEALPPEELERIGVDLYAALLAQRPTAAAALGALDVEARARKLASALALLGIVAHDRQRLGAAAIGLGARHAQRGIQRDDYLAFAEILAEMLAERQDVVAVVIARAFWRRELEAIVDVMIAVDSP